MNDVLCFLTGEAAVEIAVAVVSIELSAGWQDLT